MGRVVVSALILILLVAPEGLAQAPTGGRHVKASLVAETDAVAPGRPLVVGLRLKMDAGWHTYWRNPGDAGLPTRAKWILPDGFRAGELQWPRPLRFNTGPLVSFGYEHEVLLPVEVQVPESLSAGEVVLKARASWLECQEVCLPGKADLTLTLPVRPGPKPGAAAALFQKAREAVPKADRAWGFSSSAEEGAFILNVAPPRGVTLTEAYFYPFAKRLVDPSKPQRLTSVGKGYTIELPRHRRAKDVTGLEGVLVVHTNQGDVALQVDAEMKGGTAQLLGAGRSLARLSHGGSSIDHSSR